MVVMTTATLSDTSRSADSGPTLEDLRVEHSSNADGSRDGNRERCRYAAATVSGRPGEVVETS